MDNNQIWLILYQSILSSGDWTDIGHAARLADSAMAEYLDRFEVGS